MIFWFNAIIDSTDHLDFLNKKLPFQEDYVIDIDDIHAARKNPSVWTAAVARFVDQRPGHVRVLWIARNESILEDLRLGSEPAIAEPFPIQQVVDLFLKRLISLSLDLRIIAALEAGLDPALGRKMMIWNWQTDLTYRDLAD